MKKLILLLFVISFLNANAQVPSNKTVYDCNGNSKNIYNVLGTGKSVIVAHKGVDCSICRSQAPGLQTWAAQNTNKVEVWGAITWTYSPNSFTPECQRTTAWKSQYAWNDIFTFADSSRSWYIGASPRYFVYSAIDSSIAYQGGSQSAAQSIALAQSTVGLNTFFLQNDIKIAYSNSNLIISAIPNEVSSVRILDVKGRILTEQSSTNSAQFDLSPFTSGLKIVQFMQNNDLLGSKKVMTY